MKFPVPWRVHAEIAEYKTPAERARAYQRLREFYTGLAWWPGPDLSPTGEERAARAAEIAARFPWVAEYWARHPTSDVGDGEAV